MSITEAGVKYNKQIQTILFFMG